MDGIEANGEGRSIAEPGKRIRRQWSAGEKRQIVREAERPGAVRQLVAQSHDVHVSVLNRWRTELRIGASGGKKTVRRARLLPVQVSKTRPERAASRSVAVTAGDLIEVAFPKGQTLTVRGLVDDALLRTVLRELARC
jgi:transposase-like protein